MAERTYTTLERRQILRRIARRTQLGAWQYVTATGRPVAQRNANGTVTIFHRSGQNNLGTAEDAARWLGQYRTRG